MFRVTGENGYLRYCIIDRSLATCLIIKVLSIIKVKIVIIFFLFQMVMIMVSL